MIRSIFEKAYNSLFTRYRVYQAKKLDVKQFLYKSRHGFSIFLNIENNVDKAIFFETFERGTINLFKRLVEPGMTIFDIGANIGFYSLVASTKLKNTGKIYAFEPADIPYNQFRKNIEINNLTNVQLMKLGVAEKDGTVSFNICDDDAFNSIGSAPMREVKQTLQIEVVAIDSFCAKENISQIDILKMDTEGAEFLILSGGKGVFSSEKAPIVFCEYNRITAKGYENTLNDYEQLLKDYGYQIFELEGERLKKFDSTTSTKSDIVCMKQHHVDANKELFW